MTVATAAHPGTANAVAVMTRQALNFSIVHVVVVPGSTAWRPSTSRQTFEPEWKIVFSMRYQGPGDNEFAKR